MLALKLFGGASIESGDGILTGRATQRHRLALLAVLCITRPAAVPRDKLLAYLWPERDTEHARNLLNQAVHALRKALGEEAILSAGEELRLDARDLHCDVIAFEEALASGSPERAVGHYTGPFLDGFFLPEAHEFEQWVDRERERLAGGYARALEALAEAAEMKGEVMRAAVWWKVRATHDPCDSRVALRLMQALEASGNRAGALQHAVVHERLLRQELGIEPDPEIAALVERIRTGAARPAIPLARFPKRAPAAVGADESLPEASGDIPEKPGVGERHSRDAGVATGRAGSAGSAWRRAAGIVAVLLALIVAGWMSVNGFGRKAAEIKRVAVLPLANLTGDPQLDYFVAGMHDALIAELAQIASLTVYSRQSVLRYQGSEQSLPAIARQLGVDALVEGSVFRGGDSVRITVQLVRAHPEGHLWAGSREASLGNALALQAEVARGIAHAVRARVAPDVDARLASRQPVDPDAQQAYLRGLFHLERATYAELRSASDRLEEHRSAILHLEQAATLDPGWAAAHAKLALAYHWLASSSGGRYEAELYPKAKAAALRALALDEAEPQAHASLGFVLFRYDWDWAGAERAFRRALQLDPNSHHSSYAQYLQAAGRHDEAITHFHMAEERNPLSELLKMQVAAAYACADRHREAIARAEELQAQHGSVPALAVVGDEAGTGLAAFVGRQYSLEGRHAEAIATMEDLVRLTDSLPAAVNGLAFVYARAGRLGEARLLADRLEAQARAAGRVWRSAELHAALGDPERAVATLEAAVAGRRALLPTIRCTHSYRLLRSEPRIQELVRQVGFPN